MTITILEVILSLVSMYNSTVLPTQNDLDDFSRSLMIFQKHYYRVCRDEADSVPTLSVQYIVHVRVYVLYIIQYHSTCSARLKLYE